ncbi:MAG TPA: hypothetical protein VFQ38_11720 [Longimicrobiales bacterium]|nr:hypothetical protein [Longimicrobiales bacterium]
MPAVRSAGTHAGCVTIDREDSAYLARMFGASGYTIIQDPTDLPRALVRFVQHLVRG